MPTLAGPFGNASGAPIAAILSIAIKPPRRPDRIVSLKA
jgi:hypothetical protein